MSAYPITAINTLFLDRERKPRKGADDRDVPQLNIVQPNLEIAPPIPSVSPSPSPVLVELLSVILSREICSGISQLSTSRRGWLFLAVGG